MVVVILEFIGGAIEAVRTPLREHDSRKVKGGEERSGVWMQFQIEATPN
jgi:hypothetical protein